MSQLPPANPAPPSAKASDAPVIEPGFEVQAHIFWEKNRSVILLACVAVLLAIVGREGWQFFSAQREKTIQEDYAKVADRPDRLAAFAEANSSHALAGAAYLQLADQKFEAADYKQAAALYDKAAGSLKIEALLGRARLGAAISQINSGDKTAGETALKAIGSDQSLLAAVRAEATYHLATVAYEAGKTDEVKKLVEEVTKLDQAGAWSQRATVLLASQPAGALSATPTISFKPEGK
jgi:hypothetical protein